MRNCRNIQEENLVYAKRFLHYLLLICAGVLLCTALAVPAESAGFKRIVRIRDAKIVTFDQMMNDIRGANLVFVGENHNDIRSHEAQLSVIKALHKAKVPLAVGLEMFRADAQKALNRWTTGTLNLEDFMKVYYDNWDLPWHLYQDIFLYTKNYGIPMIGLNVSPEITHKVSQNGFASLTADEIRQLPPGISCDVDDQYRDFIKQAYEAHHGSGKSFTHFCEAQMIWDKVMAWRLLDYAGKNTGATVVVLAGNGHSWKRGIPGQVKKSSNLSYKVILTELPEHTRGEATTTADADYVYLE